jgi:hypothetical protein
MTNKENREINYYKNLSKYYKELFKMLLESLYTDDKELEHKAITLFNTTEETK